MFTVVYKAATVQSLAFNPLRHIVNVLSAYETQMFTNLEKSRECSVTYQFSLPHFLTFLGFLVTPNCYIWKRSTGTTVCHSSRPCSGRMMIPPSLNTLSSAAFDPSTLNALSAECTHHICQQVLRPQVQVQVQVFQICTKYQVLHVCWIPTQRSILLASLNTAMFKHSSADFDLKFFTLSGLKNTFSEKMTLISWKHCIVV